MKWIKDTKKNTILVLAITLIVLFIVLKNDAKAIFEAFKTIDIKYIIIAIIFYFLSIALKGYSNYLITNDKKKISIKEAIKHNLIAQFFNGITPFSSGGQPMEIYMITEHKISIPKATNQTIQSFIFYQLSLVICGLIAVIYNYIFHIFPKDTVLRNLVLLGFIINLAVIVVLIVISKSKRVTRKMSKIVIKIAEKLHIEVDKQHIKDAFIEYHDGFSNLRKRKKLLVSGTILNILSLLCLYIIPLFIVYSMGNFNSINVMETITTSAYVYIIGAFVPIPGASGGIEYGFTQFYGNFISPASISAVMIIWRFITYYTGIIFGAVAFNLEKKVKK